MTLVDAHAALFPAAADGARASRLWGLDAEGLHDRLWALRGAQVVRRGERAHVDARGPDLYLLLEPHELLTFDFAPVVRRLSWLKPALMRVRVCDVEAQKRSRERVLADARGRLVAIRRDYGQQTVGTARPMLTPDRALAEIWAAAPARRQGLRALRRAAGKDRTAVASAKGRVFRTDRPGAREAFLERLQRAWPRPGAMIDGVYEYQPGVWMHETTMVAPGSRLVGPLWIGAGVQVAAGQALVGPGVAPDAARTPEARAVPWEDLMVIRGAARRSRRRRLGFRRHGKRAFDVLFSLGVLAATAPLYPVVMAAIMLEDGWPVFFAHRRQTVGGREFPCYKFRTMCKDAEKMKAALAAKNQADGPQFFIDNDPRLLRVGRLLRKFQIDELPQFWNVLLGHMSVVGPRPSPDKENQFCPAWREARLSVRPGVTGLWQVSRTRAPETDFQEWIRYDLEYVQRQSWRLDLWIIAQTVLKVLRG